MPANAPQPVCPVGATLGEGPFWSTVERKLWFVDIKRHRIYRFDPETNTRDQWEAPAQPGWILATDKSGYLVGLKTGVHHFDPGTGAFSLYRNTEADLPGNRLNDATVDPKGRLWFGSMDDAEACATGQLHLHDRGAFSLPGIPPVSITNGPAFSPDGSILYHTDTLGGTIHAYDVAAEGSVSNPRIFAKIGPSDGYPDGPTVDAEGCVWTGLFGGWGVRRYAPDGTLLGFVRFPCANVTKIAFGGADLKTVYATTARKGLNEAALAHQPNAGDIFSFRVETPGLPLPPVAMGKDA